MMDDPNSVEGREIAIRGEVLDGSIDTANNLFIIHGDDSELIIDFSNARPQVV